jgi:hypothetical protein
MEGRIDSDTALHTWGSVLSMVAGIHWGSWDRFPVDTEPLLYLSHTLSLKTTKGQMLDKSCVCLLMWCPQNSQIHRGGR